MSYERRTTRRLTCDSSAIAELPSFYVAFGGIRVENDVPERFSVSIIYLGAEKWLPN